MEEIRLSGVEKVFSGGTAGKLVLKAIEAIREQIELELLIDDKYTESTIRALEKQIKYLEGCLR